MKIKKPPYPNFKLKPDGFPLKTKWNPDLPVSAIDNAPPQSMWPIKRGKAVFVLNRTDELGVVVAGLVSWYHPAREIDSSCCISPGCPFYKVNMADDWCIWPQLKHVFPYTKTGWKKCLSAIAERARELADEHERNATNHGAIALELRTLALAVKNQAENE